MSDEAKRDEAGQIIFAAHFPPKDWPTISEEGRERWRTIADRVERLYRERAGLTAEERDAIKDEVDRLLSDFTEEPQDQSKERAILRNAVRKKLYDLALRRLAPVDFPPPKEPV